MSEYRLGSLSGMLFLIASAAMLAIGVFRLDGLFHGRKKPSARMPLRKRRIYYQQIPLDEGEPEQIVPLDER